MQWGGALGLSNSQRVGALHLQNSSDTTFDCSAPLPRLGLSLHPFPVHHCQQEIQPAISNAPVPKNAKLWKVPCKGLLYSSVDWNLIPSLSNGLPFCLCPPLSAPFFSLKAQLPSCLQKKDWKICTALQVQRRERGKKRQKSEALIDGFLCKFSAFIGDIVILPSLFSNSICPCSRPAQEGETSSCTRKKIKPNSYPSSSLGFQKPKTH